MFIVPEWESELERTSLQRCTAVGYRLRHVADGLGMFAVVSFIAAPEYLALRWWQGRFQDLSLWSLIALPFGLVVLSQLLMMLARGLAKRRGFRFDEQRGGYRWNEKGKVVFLTSEDVAAARS